jgi:hypothetical protein
MPNSTLKQTISEILTKDDEAQRNFFNQEVDATNGDITDGYSSESRFTFLDNGITFKEEDSHGGEGQGEEYWTVYSFTKGDEKVFVKFEGSYQSYSGAEYDDFYFVEPQEKMITVYVKTEG